MSTADRSPRAEHAARTRRALIDAALELFSERGYDQTTTEEIAERANVSPRTFFRYFPTKESVILEGETHFFRSAAGLVLAQPNELSDFEAVRASFVTLAPSVARLRRRVRRHHRAVASSPTLLGRESLAHRHSAAMLAESIADRRGLPTADEDCDLLATLAVMIMVRSTARWAEGPATEGLADVLDAEFARLEKLLS